MKRRIEKPIKFSLICWYNSDGSYVPSRHVGLFNLLIKQLFEVLFGSKKEKQPKKIISKQERLSTIYM